MIVLSVGLTALLLGAWYTGYVACRQVHTVTTTETTFRGQVVTRAPPSPTSSLAAAGRGRGRGRGGRAAGTFAGRGKPSNVLIHGSKPSSSSSSSSSAAAATEAAAVPERYAVLIDAGSSGSRVHVYSYRPAARSRRGHTAAATAPYPVVRLPGQIHRVTPGLSEFAPEGEGVVESLQPLITFAQQQVPPRLHTSTPIRLLATAGLRLLPEEQREAVLAAVRALLGGSGFRFRAEWVRVISGDEEGLFAWVGINYAAGRLQALAREAASSPRRRDPGVMAGRAAATTLAVLELGGASMQLTLMPWEALPRGLGTRLKLPGVDRPLYTHSFLGYGLQVAWFREAMLVQQGGDNATDPCLHPGYSSYQSGVVGSGSFADCAALAEQLIMVSTSSATSTATAGSSSSSNGGCSYERCSIGGEYLPLLAPEKRTGGYGSAALLDPGSGGYLIMATESFYFTMDRLGLPANASLESLRTAGTRFCSRPWSDVEQELVVGRGVSEEHILKVCFGSAYIYTLLRQGFHMGPREAAYLRFSNAVERPDGSRVEVNWVLGALMHQRST
ncbi:hypothetical protein VOLCADRAFT_91259 [Volvox carteri f. nagariensis]|uniref:Apyrase n=1 Tax=Volvox carteri f. nagariensis TaxID=3068 RepID=D8TWK8_VOLCA|nr:uncharacterized protein VOLCADRAFT_91259 [Volvox carteri f. nagariensis]EFJ48169.1 hypothetical protein VOLCADRAFT_91259 [Volvox carteri f. nagariensis]|eukprot:XP_002950854.1 hypothetical protein VOLCADRAFT_91259 [Volvox carteri f. nagariensis]